MNVISPKKLINSKWTRVSPLNKERHFIVTKVEFNENSTINHCLIEAVITKRVEEINWSELKDDNAWKHGWK
jgi:tryptophan-rich hypothetical protein